MPGCSAADRTAHGARVRRRARVSILGALALLAACAAGLGGGASPRSVASQTEPVRIMLVGDSITEGSSGDWTWRYRLAQDLDASGVDYEFVGPRVTMWNMATCAHDSLEYADPAFDQHHFALWGEKMLAVLDENAPVPEDSIGWAVSTYQPDVVIEALGTNDLLWGSTPEETLGTAQQFLAEVRAAGPDTAVVLSTVPDIQYDGFSTYNDLLEAAGPGWSTPESPVVVSDLSTGWVAATDTCDNTHPSAVGEVRIAAAEADALALCGIGAPVERPLPQPPPGPRLPATVSGAPGVGQVVLSWTLPPGGTAVLVSMRDATLGESWHQIPSVVQGTTWQSDRLTDGHTYQFRVNVLKHECLAADVASSVVTLRPGVPLTVPGLAVVPRRNGFRAGWGRAALATSYRVRWWPLGHPRQAVSREAPLLARRVGGLVPGRCYVVTVQGIRGPFVGPAARAHVTPHR